MMHIALCLLAVLVAWTTPTARPVAIVYCSIQGAFFALRAPASHYGDAWFLMTAAVEACTALCFAGLNTMPARFVRWASWSAVAVNLLTYPANSPLYAVYSHLVQCSEFARIACIMVFSDPVWRPLTSWYNGRRAKKDDQWLAYQQA